MAKKTIGFVLKRTAGNRVAANVIGYCAIKNRPARNFFGFQFIN